jgi:hypothetical protein
MESAENLTQTVDQRPYEFCGLAHWDEQVGHEKVLPDIATFG